MLAAARIGGTDIITPPRIHRLPHHQLHQERPS
jgi:hypothetical protein